MTGVSHFLVLQVRKLKNITKFQLLKDLISSFAGARQVVSTESPPPLAPPSSLSLEDDWRGQRQPLLVLHKNAFIYLFVILVLWCETIFFSHFAFFFAAVEAMEEEEEEEEEEKEEEAATTNSN